MFCAHFITASRNVLKVFSSCRSLVSAAALAVCALVFCSCAGYKLGPTGGMEAGERSVQVAPVVNSTLEPRLSAAVNNALRKQIQRDGTMRLETREGADIILNTQITHYNRRGIGFSPKDTLTTTDYELTIVAKIVAINRHTGKELVNKEVKGRTTIPVGTDMVSAEAQALPSLADNLAHNAIDLIVDGSW